MQPSTRVFFQSIIRPRQDPHHTLASGNKRCPSTSSEGSGRLRILGGKARFWPMTVRERHARVKVQSRYGTNLHNCVTAIPYSLVYSRCWREISRLPVATLVLGHDRRNKKAGIDGASARTSHLRASDRTSTGFLRDRSSFTSFTRRDQRTARKRATGTHAPMAEGPLAWLHPFDSGLHSFPSLDAGTDLLGLPPSNCGVAAKMAFSELAAMDLLRTPSGLDTRAADAQPPETSRRDTGADATSAGEKPFPFDAQRAHAGAPSTSYVPSEVRLPLIDDPCA